MTLKPEECKTASVLFFLLFVRVSRDCLYKIRGGCSNIIDEESVLVLIKAIIITT